MYISELSCSCFLQASIKREQEFNKQEVYYSYEEMPVEAHVNQGFNATPSAPPKSQYYHDNSAVNQEYGGYEEPPTEHFSGSNASLAQPGQDYYHANSHITVNHNSSPGVAAPPPMNYDADDVAVNHDSYSPGVAPHVNYDAGNTAVNPTYGQPFEPLSAGNLNYDSQA